MESLKKSSAQQKLEQHKKKVEEMTKKFEKLNQHQINSSNVDLNCAICLNLMSEPCLLPCKHRFCISCIRDSFRLNTCCPICRQTVDTRKFCPKQVDTKYQEEVKAQEKDLFEQKEKELQNGRGKINDQCDIEFDIGNHYGVIKNPAVSNGGHKDNIGKVLKHHWSAFVRVKYPNEHPPIEKLVEKVDFKLHETFK